jgi:hypothetical protein
MPTAPIGDPLHEIGVKKSAHSVHGFGQNEKKPTAAAMG